MPVRLTLSRKKGFNLQALSLATNGLPAVNVARPTKWGNPFTVASAIEVGYAKDADRARIFVVDCFRHWLAGSDRDWMGDLAEERRSQFLANMHTLRGKNLACWCKDGPCHADVLLKICEEVF